LNRSIDSTVLARMHRAIITAAALGAWRRTNPCKDRIGRRHEYTVCRRSQDSPEAPPRRNEKDPLKRVFAQTEGLKPSADQETPEKGVSREEYHQRSKSETVNSTLKRRYESTIRARKNHTQRTDVLLKILTHNLTLASSIVEILKDFYRATRKEDKSSFMNEE